MNVTPYNELQAQRFLRGLYPNEAHGLEGDCINPKCDYVFTDADKQDMMYAGGWFTCPQCGFSYDYYYDPIPGQGGYTRAGITMDQMGKIGEDLIYEMHDVPALGTLTWFSTDKKNPLDAHIGPFGVEIKTNHSQAQARFKITGSIYDKALKKRVPQRAIKLEECQRLGLRPAVVGVRLNFYTDQADVFVRPDSMSDTWIGNKALLHVATVGFDHLNPFKHPHEVPPPDELPEDDSTPPVDPLSDADIPF